MSSAPRAGQLVTLIAREKHLSPEARAALAAVLARTTDNRLKARVKLMLPRADQGCEFRSSVALRPCATLAA